MKLTHPIWPGNGIYYFIIPYWRISNDSIRSGVVRTSANNCVVKYASYFLQFSTVTVREFFCVEISLCVDLLMTASVV